MEWSQLIKSACARPGMYAPRPYVDGLCTLWFGFSAGSGDDSYTRFQTWVSTVKDPAGGYHNSLATSSILRAAVGANPGRQITDEQDDRAIALLAGLVDEFLSL